MLTGLLSALLAPFCPTECAGCHAAGPLCPACRAALDALPGACRIGRGPWQPLAATPVLPAGEPFGLCLGPYRGLLQRMLVAAKRRRHPGAAAALAARVGDLVGRLLPGLAGDVSGLVVPPPSPDRSLSHPAPVLAGALAAVTGLPLLGDLVLRRDTPGKARFLGREQRPAHVAATFLAGPARLRRGARVLLVDDLVTTGATLAHLTRLLAWRGIAVGGAITFAYTPRIRAG